ncbi:MAG TPA: TonB-dependent receptor plug domain-containing protein [Opitutus sp.]|nr:TonB-dependent receptor plug domain-containing protein [Opitutus sp.]
MSGLHAQTTVSSDSKAKDDDTVVLSPFEVSVNQDQGYAPSESLSGTKVRTPLRDIPMNIQVVTSDFIQDTGAFNLQEAMAYNASVSVSDNSYQATVRGFTSSWQLRNGFRYYKRTDASEVARIETISGPAAVLYGITQPGGILNIITKQPTGRNSAMFFESYSSDTERAEGDVNVRLNDRLSMLLVGAYENDTTQFDYIDNRFRLFSPTVAWQIDPNTKLTVNMDWTDYAHPFSQGYLAYNGVPIQTSVSEGGLGVPLSRNYEGPDNRYDELTRTFSATLEHRFGENLTARIAYNSHHQTSDEEYMGVGVVKAPAGNAEGIPAGTVSIRGTWRHYILLNDMDSIAADGLWHFETGPVKNQILFGGTTGTDKFYSDRYYDWDASGNYVYRYWAVDDPNPDVREPGDINWVYQTSLASGARREENTVSSVYLTHQAHLWDDRVITLAGVIYNDIDDYIRSHQGEEQRYAAHKYSPQIGLVGRPLSWLSVYGLYATSLYPQSGGSRSGFGDIFPPVEGKSFEYGVKFENPDRTISGTASIYDIVQDNLVVYDETAPNADNPTADPNLPRGANVATGETKSTGLDLSVYYRPVPELQIIGSYALNDTRVTSDTRAYMVGRKITPYFRNQAAVWTKYDFAKNSELHGVGVGLGLTWHGSGLRGYSSSSASGVPNTQKSQFNAQLRLSYAFKLAGFDAIAAIDGRNLARAETVTGGAGNVGYYFDTPREVRFSLRLFF